MGKQCNRRAGRRCFGTSIALALVASFTAVAPVTAATKVAARADLATRADFATRTDLATRHRHDIVNASLGLARSELVTLEYDHTVGVPLTISVPVAGTTRTLDLAPYSVRSDLYAVYRSDGPDHLEAVEPGLVNTLRGVIAGEDGAVVAASLRVDGFRAMIQLASGDRYWVEPAGHLVDGLAPGSHVVYHESDTIPNGGSCGTSEAQLVRQHAERQPQAAEEAGPADGDLANCELACDADWPYYLDYGSSVSNVEDRINEVTNAMNLQYEAEVDITHVITTIIVRTTPGTYSSSDAGDLLDEFRLQWLQNHGTVVRDVAELFTGRALAGSTIGIAYTIGGICTSNAYCLVESDFSGNFNCVTDLSAHELGHLWGAFHCECPSNTMNPSITCANTFTPASRSSIITHRNSRTCLNPLGVYCVAFSSNSSFERISNVTFGAIDHDSGAGTYSDFTSVFTNVTEGDAVPFSMTIGNPDPNSDIGALWIDWNGDGDFADDGEEVATFSGAGPYTTTVMVPGSVTNGSSRMRVRIQDSDFDWELDPCGPTAYGEVEDYGINLFSAPKPANDDCVNATPIGEETLPFTNLGATTDGPFEPQLCDANGDNDIGSDVWFSFDPPCGGQFTVSLCGSNYNTRIGVYSTCPTESLQILACNDDFCGEQSQVAFVGFAGTFLIRVGGYLGERGSGTISVSAQCLDAGACCMSDGTCELLGPGDCGTVGGTFLGIGLSCNPSPCAPVCPEDLSGNAAVDFADILAVIAAWGACPPQCPEDLDGSGDVGFGDILTVIGAWGVCP
ncbi:MAG: hypothetical protein GY715_19560 [Planctomycetes bacterium]|nr:hypothetical protein [Planctomycetota bacterium]